MSEQNTNNQSSVTYADSSETEVVLENTLLKRKFKKKFNKKTIIIVAIILTAIAVFAGVRLVKVLPERLFFQIVTWALLAVSVKLIWDGLSA